VPPPQHRADDGVGVSQLHTSVMSRVRGTRAPSALLARRYRAWPLNCLSLGPCVAWCESPLLDDGMRQMNWLHGPILEKFAVAWWAPVCMPWAIFFSVALLYFQQGSQASIAVLSHLPTSCVHANKVCTHSKPADRNMSCWPLAAHLRALCS